MRQRRGPVTRRDLLQRAVQGAAGAVVALHLPGRVPAKASTAAAPSQAALVAGDSRGGNVLEALRLIEGPIKQGLARKKRVVLKPNMVVTDRQLSATHVDCLEAALEFLRPLVKDEIIIADSSASGSVRPGYENYGFYRLQRKYKVKFLDLDEEPTVIRHAIDHRYQPRAVRMSKLLLDPETYIVSSAILKTHDRTVVTLSLKNVVVGAAVKDRTFRWGPGGKGSNDKQIIHGGPANEGIHYNLFSLGRQLHPDLALIDGFQGMEHNGPVAGTPVDHKVAVASTDWLAADRIGVELMGFDFAKIGYLTFCARASMGQADLDRIDVLGANVADHVRQYRPHDTIEQQYKWMLRR